MTEPNDPIDPESAAPSEPEGSGNSASEDPPPAEHATESAPTSTPESEVPSPEPTPAAGPASEVLASALPSAEEPTSENTSSEPQEVPTVAEVEPPAALAADASEHQPLTSPTPNVEPEWANATQRIEPDHTPTTQIPPLTYSTLSPHDATKQKKKSNRFARNIAVVTGIVLLSGISGVTGAAVFHASNEQSLPVSQTALDRPSQTALDAGSVEKVATAVLPSTVKINVRGAGSAGQGTGVIISEDGVVITNNHVIEAAAERGQITVVFQDGTNASATIVGRDPATDVAVIKAKDVSGLKPATLGTSSNLQVGQRVVAIGSPFGLEATVTEGIVSALNRPVSPGDQLSAGANRTIFPAIQTDAAINPGNSGGPLVDLAGRVIGINSAISTGGNSTGSIGLGFAIPINLVSSVSEQILAGDEVEHARIGVNVVGATGEDNLTEIGAQIGEVVAGSAGEDAGLRNGDIVTGVDGHPIATNDGLVATIRGYRPGDTVTLTILRDGQTQDVELTLGSDRDATNR